MKIEISGFRLHPWYQAGMPGWRLIGAILLLNISLMTGAFAQNKIWDKTIGGDSEDILQSIRHTKDGGYLLGGHSYSGRRGDKSEGNKGGLDYWLVKIQSDGTKIWDKTIGGDNYDYLRTSLETSDGGYILGGYSYSGKSSDKSGNSKGGLDYWVVKLNSKGEKVWDRTIGGDNDDVLQSLLQTRDGGFILFGYSASGFSGDKSQASNGNHDYWIVKLKADGSKAWDKSYGGNNQDIATSIQQTSNGGFILAGYSASNISGDKSQDSKGGEDYWVVKIKADGNKEWDRTYGGNNQDVLASVQQTSDRGFLLGGTSNSDINGDKSQSSKGGNDYWVVKLKADGSKEWDRTIGGNSDDNLSSAQQTPDGSYILGGNSYSNISGNKTQLSKGGYDYWIVKLNLDGTYAWDKTIGANSEDILTALQQTQDGNYLLGGYSYSNKSDDKSQNSKGWYDYWIVKVDNSGTNLNQLISLAPFTYKTLGDPPMALSATINTGLPITFTVESGPATISNGNILTLTGVGTVTVKAAQLGNGIYQPVSATRSFLVEPASKVDKQWNKIIGGNSTDRLTSIQQTSDKGYILGGTSDSGKSGDKSQGGKGSSDYWIVKLKADGSKEWDKTFGGSSSDNLATVQQTSDGGYILGGYSSSGKSGDKSQASKGSNDYWIVKLKADGTKDWDKTFGGKNQDWLTSLQQTSDGGYILGGYSVSGIGADKTEDYRGLSDYWVIKLKPDGTKEWDKTLGGRYEDVLSSIQQTNEGSYILGGYSLSGISSDKSQARIGNNDFWIVKLKADGSKDWDKTLGGSDEDYLTSLEQTSDEGYILGGYSWSSVSGDKSQKSKGGYDYWVLKLKADGTKDWDKTLGGNESEVLTMVHQTNDGGYILGGNSFSAISGDKTQVPRSAPDYDYWLIKLKADGTKAWDKTLGGNNNDLLSTVQQTGDGEYLVGGTTDSGISGDKSESGRGSQDFWLVMLKEDIDLITTWEYRFGGVSEDKFTNAIITFDGGYLAAGYTASDSSGDKSQVSYGQNDYWIVKTDKNGQKQWDKRYGGSANDFLNRVLQTQDGGYLLAGSSLSDKSGDKTEDSQGDRDYWVVKVDKQGNKEWDKTLGGSGYDELQKVIQLSTGEYVLGGTSNSPVSGDKSQASQGGQDYWLVKISNTGTKIWDKRYGGSLDETLGSFTNTRDNGFFLGGSSRSDKNGDKTQASQGSTDYWVVKTDQEGNLLWEKTYGGSGAEVAYSVGRGYQNNLFIAGTSNSGKEGDKSQPSQGGKDYWLIKLDEKGNLIWDKTFGGSKDDELGASTFTDDEHYVLAGTSFSQDGGDKTQISRGSSDYWVVQINEAGQQVADQRYGGSGQDELRSVFQTKDGGLLLGGRSDSGVSGDRSQPSQGSTDYWLVKVEPLTSTLMASRKATTLAESAAKSELKLLRAFPNPVKDHLTVSFTLPQTQVATVKVYNSQGRVIAILFQSQVQANQKYQVEWQASNQAAGMYYLQLQTPTTRLQEKLILAK